MTKKNRELAKIFRDYSIMLEFEGVEWKPRAYSEAAQGLENLREDAEEIFKREGMKGLKKINGVGSRIAEYVAEYLKTGKIKNVEALKKKYSEAILEMTELEGLGPKKVKRLMREISIKSFSDLEKAVQTHKIRELKGFGEKTEKNIAEAFTFYKKKGRMLLSEAMPLADETVAYLKTHALVGKINYVGSLRRMKETIGDIDILATAKSAKEVMRIFTNMPGVKKIIAQGPTKSTILLSEKEAHVDIRVVKDSSYAAALQYFTGSKEHNIETRKIALKKGYKLSEYDLLNKKTGKPIYAPDEQVLYKKLGLEYIPPEMRENRGEIELAQKGKMPKLVELKDIKGDLHVHSNFSEGVNKIEEIIRAAEEKKYEYIAVTDHSPSLPIARGVSEKRLREQWKEIDRVARTTRVKILKGAEVDIRPDGSLDYPERILKNLDIVVGAIHSNFKMPEREMTKRIVTALKNPYLKILAHPTGRIINFRPEYKMDLKEIFLVAEAENRILEINSQPARLDLNDELIFEARKYKIKFAISTDSHSIETFDFMRYGVGQARRGWLEKKDVVNALGWEEFKKHVMRKVGCTK